ncbi:MAG: DUF3078 domain-containing protein [Elusimicrobia bacterium]|nr:DUF3078 domain-containing protein [Elusimicrobiota bacterium]MBR4633354.1 DUF3078 domain-containing protein [Elusimicrobiota bacterium]
MKKLSLLAAALVLLFSTTVFAGTKDGWELELKQLAVSITSTEVHNSSPTFTNARLTTDSQTAVQGKLDFDAKYFAPKLLWTNNLFMEYGKTSIRPVDKEEVVTENADKITLTTDLTYRLWKVEEDFLGGFEAGPFANIGYETEFEPAEIEIDGHKERDNRKQVLRGKVGAKLFEGKYLKELYAAYVFERDFTYTPESTNTAFEAGFRAEAEIREGVKFVAWSYYRDYQTYSEERISDLDYEIEAELRLDVKLWNNIAIAPFINYYCASAQHFNCVADNWYTGIQISYSTFFKKAKEI